jgi:hypothetical protein
MVFFALKVVCVLLLKTTKYSEFEGSFSLKLLPVKGLVIKKKCG